MSLDLEPIRARLVNATPGPWYVESSHNELWLIAGVLRDQYGDNAISSDSDRATIEFIAAAPADIAAMLAELSRLRADYRTLWGMTLGHDGQPPTEGTADDVERLRQRFTDLNEQ